jgi:CBS domain-containing protein
MQIRSMMSEDIKYCRENENLDCAAALMWNHDIGSVPVVDAERRVVGMITDRDVCMAAYTQGKRLAEIPVDQVMSNQIVTVGPDDTLPAAERLMREAQVRRLPVTDREGRLIGVVSQNDLLREAAENQTVREAITVTIAEIGKSRNGASRVAPI